MAQYDDSQLLALIAQCLPDNTDELITPMAMRYLLAQLVASKVNVQAVLQGGVGGLIAMTPTEGIGGIVAGKDYNLTAEGYLRALLVKYQVPTFTTFTIAGQASRTVPVGTTFPVGFKSVAWATANNVNVKPNSLTIRDVTGNTILASGKADNGTASLSTAGFTAILGQSRVYLIAGVDTNTSTFFSTLTISGETEGYLGASTAASLDGAQLVDLGGAQLQGSRARSVSGVTTTGGQYLYYAYDNRHGDLTSIILDGAAPVLGAFRKLGDVPSLNAAGAPVLLRVYRSNAVNAFSANALAFS